MEIELNVLTATTLKELLNNLALAQDWYTFNLVRECTSFEEALALM